MVPKVSCMGGSTLLHTFSSVQFLTPQLKKQKRVAKVALRVSKSLLH